MPNQSSIDSKLSKIKQWYHREWPLCLFCNHYVKPEFAQLAHIIRRSYSREYQDLKLNTGLSHPDCHDITDNHPDQAIYLPRFLEIQFIGWLIDPEWHNEQKLLYDFYKFPDFTELSDRHGHHLINYQHHGELFILM
ncbi:MAG TPA: hypothetical protein ENH82_03530 [bacterium]|nr:hypothetical protein [bacterium]